MLHDALLRHQVYVQRSAGALRRTVVDRLRESERKIFAEVRRRAPLTAAGLSALLVVLRRLRRSAWAAARREWLAQLAEIAAQEPEFLAETLAELAPISLRLAALGKRDAQAEARKAILLGKTPEEWFDDLAEADEDRYATSVRFGYQKDDDSKALLVALGLLSLQAYRDVETVSVTTSLGISNFLQQEFFLRNNIAVDYWRFVAVLDNRTTPICRALSGKKFEIGKGPIPPLHWRCRSKPVPIVRGFGREAEPESYQQWLRRQPVLFQDEILGRTRGRLFRSGGVSLDKFVDFDTYHQYTIGELRRREAAAFRAAGLN